MTGQYLHSLRFDADKCDGCMSCLRVCPTAAVRIRMGHAVMLEDRCIDCGECLRVCPEGAIVPLTDSMADLTRFDATIAIPSPALYTQFEPDVGPGMIHAALRLCGFDEVESVSPSCDLVTVATETYLAEYRGQFPVLSSFCPAVVLLIQVKYPELVDQLIPIIPPREILAREAKVRYSARTGLAPDRIGTVYLTPCPAKMVTIMNPACPDARSIDTAVSIANLYRPLAAAIARVRGQEPDTAETGTGLSWAYMGGMPSSLSAENSLSVAGLPNVIRILDDIEKGRLRRYSFVEMHACPEGCVSGPLTVENPYVARSKAIRLRARLGRESTVDAADFERRHRSGELRMRMTPAGRPLRPLDEDIGRAILKMKERDRIMAELPGIDCGACGAPTCRAFAEDVVLGDVEVGACVFHSLSELEARVEGLLALVRAARPAPRRQA